MGNCITYYRHDSNKKIGQQAEIPQKLSIHFHDEDEVKVAARDD